MPSTDQHLSAIAATATSTPRAPGGMRLALTISLYKPGHAGLDGGDGSGLPMNGDDELVRCLAAVIAKVRERM